MRDTVKFAILFPATVLAGAIVYVFVHELGHTIVALICGARITQFSILSAHMSYSGGVFSEAMFSLFHSAGALLPALCLVPLILSFKQDKDNMIYRCIYTGACCWGIFPLLAWIVVPMIGMLSSLPQGDDVTKFIVSSGWPPVAVLLCSFIVLAIILLLALKKGVFQEFIKMIKRFGADR